MRPYDVGLLCGRFQTIHNGMENRQYTARIMSSLFENDKEDK